ncbi:hypothetical protein GCM10010421_42310 [Streptomyces glaucus]|uniref:Uncharacterized protein n=1 Tax=Streptomyces glaucus TaxID=284029 RepID=A0ABP5X6N3_9ACTN
MPVAVTAPGRGGAKAVGISTGRVEDGRRRAEEGAEAAAWLCGDRAPFVAGTAPAVDGGRTARWAHGPYAVRNSDPDARAAVR